MSKRTDHRKTGAVIALEDLAPQRDPRGGASRTGKTVFGGGASYPDPQGRESSVKESEKKGRR